MRIKFLQLLVIMLFGNSVLFAQKADSLFALNDSVILQSVTVTAFSAKLPLKDVPASIAFISKKDLTAQGVVSLLPAVNTVPGVRMEERSPGSFRLSVRGSLLRSPFGVRNIKVYWDELPLTDATGNTYINLVDANSIQSMEIIKGPASSFYGANTGGAIILHSNTEVLAKKNQLQFGLAGGSFGLFSGQAGWHYSSTKFVSDLQQSYVRSDGYRQQSALDRNIIRWNGKWMASKNTSISFLALYTRLHYETPGGITQAQYDTAPRLARLAAGSFPGAITQKTAVYNETGLAAITLQTKLTGHITNSTTVGLNKTDFQNPFITNFEKRKEWNYSARTNFAYTYKHNSFKLEANAGADFQYNDSYIRVYGNKAGVPDTTQYKDKVHVTQYFLFAQVNMNIAEKWFLQAGISNNDYRFWYNRVTPVNTDYPKIKNADPAISPRLGISYAVLKSTNIFANISKGFSPPSLAEVRPSSGVVNETLQAEYGWNYEVGIKGTLLQNSFSYSASFNYFNLKSAIVRRNDANGADYFVNAGSTIQKGLEIWWNARIIEQKNSLVRSLHLWNSLAYQPYYFDSYTIGTTDYSGNKITGVPRTVNITGVDIITRHLYYANIMFNYTSAIQLNDANTVASAPYHLLQIKIGKQLQLKNTRLDIFAGADNLLNEKYSLGNDINAAGNRYFNAASTRNYYAGVKIIL